MTHSHGDHTHGMDDVRPLVIKARKRIALHMDEITAVVVRRTFPYVFETPPGSLYPPLLDEKRIRRGEPIDLEGPGGAIAMRSDTALTPSPTRPISTRSRTKACDTSKGSISGSSMPCATPDIRAISRLRKRSPGSTA